MSFLEYLGLEYLLDDLEGGIESSGGLFGILGAIGGVGWLILAIFRGSVVDKGAVVFNLLATLLLLIITIIKFIKSRNERQTINKIFYVISLIVIIIAFIYGLNNPYHALFFNYEYIGFYSGLGTTFWPLVVINMLFPFFCTDNDLGEKVGGFFGGAGLALLLLVLAFFIGQIGTVIISFSGNEKIFGNFVIYHDLDITEERIDWDYNSVEDCIKALLPKDAKNAIEKYQTTNVNMIGYTERGEKENFDKYTLQYLKQNYPGGEMTKYGILFSSRKIEDDYTIVYRLLDKEFATYYYVKFNLKDYSITDFVDADYFNNVKNMKNN